MLGLSVVPLSVDKNELNGGPSCVVSPSWFLPLRPAGTGKDRAKGRRAEGRKKEKESDWEIIYPAPSHH